MSQNPKSPPSAASASQVPDTDPTADDWESPEVDAAGTFDDRNTTAQTETLEDQIWRDWRAAIAPSNDPEANARLEQAWAAGLVDGAGTFADTMGRVPEIWSDAILQICERTGEQGRLNLMRFQQAVGGAGSISGPYIQMGSPRYCYVWEAKRAADINKVWQAVGPFLGRAKFAEFRRVLVAAAPPPVAAVAVSAAPTHRRAPPATARKSKRKAHHKLNGRLLTKAKPSHRNGKTI